MHFFVLGLALLVGQRALSRASEERPSVRVVVPPGISAAERELRVDAAILVEEGLALGWARTDPVIRGRLVSNLRFARGEPQPLTETGEPAAGEDDAELLEEALSLDMQRTDLIVRRRLVARAERLLTSDVRSAPVDDETLLAFRDAHPERFMAPPRYRYVDLFLSRQRHGEALAEVAATMQRRLAAEHVPPEQAAALSDPLLYSPGDRWVSGEELERRLGGALASNLANAPIGAWSGPFESSFGLHFVWLRERRAATPPTLDEARARILGAYRDARQEEAVRTRMAELRTHYDVVIEEQEGAP